MRMAEKHRTMGNVRPLKVAGSDPDGMLQKRTWEQTVPMKHAGTIVGMAARAADDSKEGDKR